MTGLNKQGVLSIKITDEKKRKIANLLLTEGGMTKKELHETCFDPTASRLTTTASTRCTMT